MRLKIAAAAPDGSKETRVSYGGDATRREAPLTMNLTTRAGRSSVRVRGAGLLLLLLLSLLLATAAAALKAPWGSTPANRLRPLPPPPRPGRAGQVKEFSLADVRGQPHTSREWGRRK